MRRHPRQYPPKSPTLGGHTRLTPGWGKPTPPTGTLLWGLLQGVLPALACVLVLCLLWWLVDDIRPLVRP